MGKTTKQVKHLFNIGVAILFTGFILKIASLL